MNKEIILYPEILASVIKNNEEDIFCLWLLSKKIDINNNGLIDIKELINIAKLCLGIKSNYVYTKISKGVNKYWREPFGKNGKKKIGLLSLDKITFRLKPDITRSKPVSIHINELKSDGLNSRHIRSLFVSIIAGRYDDKRPISVGSLIHNTGLKRSSIFDILKESKYLKVINNYSIVSEDYNKNNLISIMQNTDTPWSHRIIETNGIYRLIKQLPNTYVLNDFDRLPLKKRPKCLKLNDKVLIDNLKEARYNCEGTNKYLDNELLISFVS